MERFDFSVVIPTRDRPEKLEACLAALARQSFPADRFEIIVVDAGSGVSLEDVVGLGDSQPNRQLIRQAKAGPARARNAGAARARGVALAFTDDDCEPADDWLSVLWSQLAEHPDKLIGGRTVNGLPANPYSTTSQGLIDYLYDYYFRIAVNKRGRVPAAPPFFTSNNLAMRSTVFRSVDGFDEKFPFAGGEDRELCDRLQRQGHRLQYTTSAIVRHGHDLTLAQFWKQHLRYGRGAVNLRDARASQGAPAVGLEPLSFYVQLLRYPFTTDLGHSPLKIAPLFVIAQLANVAGFRLERRRRETATAPTPRGAS